MAGKGKCQYWVSFHFEKGTGAAFGGHEIFLDSPAAGAEEILAISKFIEQALGVRKVVILNIIRLPI
jgi:hypothetical protein